MSLNKHRILYTEDHVDTQELVSFILNRLDYEVVITPNSVDALRLAQAERFDLYMLDTRLTDGSGVDLCRRIREFDTATPILFYSANALDSEKKMAMESGAQGYLTKPATPGELSGAISKLVARSRAASSTNEGAARS
ncbi:MAG TPA: response regulator [Pyrinomonadaceae bacterium]|nr:response regulator [Pyrinomonadaceae bacterium]